MCTNKGQLYFWKLPWSGNVPQIETVYPVEVSNNKTYEHASQTTFTKYYPTATLYYVEDLYYPKALWQKQAHICFRTYERYDVWLEYLLLPYINAIPTPPEMWWNIRNNKELKKYKVGEGAKERFTESSR